MSGFWGDNRPRGGIISLHRTKDSAIAPNHAAMAAKRTYPAGRGLEPLTKPSWRRCPTLPHGLHCLRTPGQDRCAGFGEQRSAQPGWLGVCGA